MIIPVPAASPPLTVVLMLTIAELTLLVIASTSRSPLVLPVDPPLGRLLPPDPPFDPPLGKLPGRFPDDPESGVAEGWNEVAAELVSAAPVGAVAPEPHAERPGGDEAEGQRHDAEALPVAGGAAGARGLATATGLSGTLDSLTTFS